LILSTTTFLIIFTPFEIYWSFREIWFDRWSKLYLKDISILNIKIQVKKGYLAASLVTNNNKMLTDSKNTIVIVCHGFSDTKSKLQYFSYPLASQGYIVLAYDARGIGESKNIGRRSDFIQRIEDYNDIIKWVKKNEKFKDMNIYAVGFSIGAVTVLSGSFTDENVQKIIAISSISNYKRNLPKYNLFLLFTYLIKGVKLFPSDQDNKILSPYLIIQKFKNFISSENWKKYLSKVFLIHSRNDKVIKIKNFYENAKILELPERNKLIFSKGGHVLKKNELSLVGASLNFFNNVG
jgi:esterase/lipase